MNELQKFYMDNQAVFLRSEYMKLINYRSDKMYDKKHELQVLKGYAKIHVFLNRFGNV